MGSLDVVDLWMGSLDVSISSKSMPDFWGRLQEAKRHKMRMPPIIPENSFRFIMEGNIIFPNPPVNKIQ
jgi:hypothetical protein